MIKYKSKKTVAVYFKGVSIGKMYYKGILVWSADTGGVACFNSGNGSWEDTLPWDDTTYWVD